MNKIITLDNGTVIGEYKSETLIDFYYESKIHDTICKDFALDAVLRGYGESDFNELNEFNNEHNTLETYTKAIMDTANRCDCVGTAKLHLAKFN